MTQHSQQFRSDTGAVLVHAALALIGLMALSTFIVDYGILWTSRRQAQNAADAGALAGAAHMFYDTGMVPTGDVLTTARDVALTNNVWAAAPAVNSSFECPSYAPAVGAPDCVRVNVFRDQAHGNALPMLFGAFLGRNLQDVRATATARVLLGNATDCLKPWGVVDKWAEHHPIDGAPYTSTSVYDRYTRQGDVDTSITNPDVYVAPTANSVGTGFHPYNPDGSYSEDYGRQINLKVGDQSDFQFATGWFAALQLGPSGGGKTYSENIKGCVGITYKIGDELELNTEPGEKVGPTKHAVETDADSIVNSDPYARWDSAANGGRGGVVDSNFASSPRIVAVPIVDPEHMAALHKGGRTTVRISNIMGFFVEGYDNSEKAVVGRLMMIPGLMTVSTPPIGGQSAFMRVISLIR